VSARRPRAAKAGGLGMRRPGLKPSLADSGVEWVEHAVTER
jgi:hypothetical protein